MQTRHVAVIDDDLFTRQGAAKVLAEHPAVAEPSVCTLDEAMGYNAGYWRRFDVLVVDIHDHTKEIGEIGTDVYSGVTIIRSIRRRGIGVRILAIAPNRTDPLLTERLRRSGADFVYERVDFRQPADLIRAVIEPDERHRPVGHSPRVLLEEGLGRGVNPNTAVDILMASPLYGRLRPGVTQAATGPRRAALRLRDDVVAAGFVGSGDGPRWNEVRDFLLKLIGRMPVRPRNPPPVDRR